VYADDQSYVYAHDVSCVYAHKLRYVYADDMKEGPRLVFATNYKILQHTTRHCNKLQDTTTHWNTRQHTATHGNALQHTSTLCNTLQHSCKTLQETAKRCKRLHHTRRHCNTSERPPLTFVPKVRRDIPLYNTLQESARDSKEVTWSLSQRWGGIPFSTIPRK